MGGPLKKNVKVAVFKQRKSLNNIRKQWAAEWKGERLGEGERALKNILKERRPKSMPRQIQVRGNTCRTENGRGRVCKVERTEGIQNTAALKRNECQSAGKRNPNHSKPQGIVPETINNKEILPST